MTKIGQRRRSTNRPPTDAGICELCTADVTRWTSARHLAQCAPAYDTPSAPLQTLLQFRATSPGLPAYWIDFEAKADTTLKAVDAFLRRIWLECCGHLSAFHIGGVDYFSEGYEFGLSGGFGSRAAERSMNVRLREALPLTGRRFDYEYDFGSTTRIKLQLTGERPGRIGRPLVRLLAENAAPEFACATCGEPATLVCSYCVHEGPGAFACAEHSDQHACGERESFLPIVNSPRMGVCAYGAV